MSDHVGENWLDLLLQIRVDCKDALLRNRSAFCHFDLTTTFVVALDLILIFIAKEIAADKVCGSFIGKDGLKYTWDIKNFTIETDLDAYTLQILTRGGWWL